MRILYFVPLALLAAPLRAGSAQEPRRLSQPDSIPLELATALLSAGAFGAEPEILVGAAPGWVMPRMYVPSGGRVLGSAFLGQSVTAIVEVPTGADTSISAVKSQFLERGWTVPPPPPTFGGGGFRPAPSTAVSSRITLCGNQEMLSAYARRHEGANAYLVEHIAALGSGYSVCHPPQMQQMISRSPFPTLIDPPGSMEDRGNGACMASLMGSTLGTGTTIRAPMSPQDLLDYYGRELADSGWKQTLPGVPSIVRTWTRTDSAGTPAEVTLTVTPASGDVACHAVYMQVRTTRKP